MAQGFSAELLGVLDSTLTVPAKVDGALQGGRLRVYQATLDLSLATVKGADGDTNVLFRIPKGEKPICGVLLASATMGAAATIAIGKSGTPAKYRAAAVFTTANVPTPFMLSSAADDAALTAAEDVILTVGTAALPGAGILQVFFLTAGK